MAYNEHDEIAGVPYDMLDDYQESYPVPYQAPAYPGFGQGMGGFGQMGFGQMGMGSFGQGFGQMGMGGFGQGGYEQDPDEIDDSSSEGKALRDCAVVNNNGQAYEQCRGGFVRQQTDGRLSTGTKLSGCGFISQNGEQFERCNQVFVRQVNGASQTF